MDRRGGLQLSPDKLRAFHLSLPLVGTGAGDRKTGGGAHKLPMGELEAAVMDVLWSDGGPLTPGQVHQRLSQERPLAYTTVMTVLVRLWQKGRLVRDRRGRAYVYTPVQSRQEYAASRMGNFLAATGDSSGVLSRFVEGLSDAERTHLRRLLGGRARS